MNQKRYEKKIVFQKNLIDRQSKQIEDLELQVRNLQLEIEEKNRIINSVEHLRNELIQNVERIKQYKEQYKELVQELRKMKEVFNSELYKGKWRIIKFLIR